MGRRRASRRAKKSAFWLGPRFDPVKLGLDISPLRERLNSRLVKKFEGLMMQVRKCDRRYKTSSLNTSDATVTGASAIVELAHDKASGPRWTPKTGQ